MEANNLHDLVIRNGKIFDGSGKKPFFGYLPIDHAKITTVGKIPKKWYFSRSIKNLAITYHKIM
jgi:N-acyl-D-aspartate/D-glutamate deacylase